MGNEEQVRLPIGEQYNSFKPFVIRATILPIIPLALYWSGLGFIARQWANNSLTAIASAGLFLSTPLLGWHAWKLSRLAGLCQFLALFAAIWLPPWAVTETEKMFKPTILGLLLFFVWGLALLIKNSNKK